MKLLVTVTILVLFPQATVRQKQTQQKIQQKRTAVAIEECRAALRELAARHGKAKTITAAYRQERTTALLKKPLVSKGKLLLRKAPACMIFRASGKRRTTIRLTYAHYEVLRPTRKVLERTPLADRTLPDALFQAFSPGLARLDKAFTIAAAWRRGAALEIRLRPKQQATEFLQDFTIVIDTKRNALRRVGYRDPQGDRVTLVLSGVKLDPKLPKGAFELTLPAGTKTLVHKPVGRRSKR